MPWRDNLDPYWIVVSEIMLQQTQVPRVLIKFAEFIEKFPTWEVLAVASQADVLRAWQGLGYNRRALFLKRMSARVVAEHGGILPRDPELLVEFPGIGNATAASVAAYAYNMPTVFIETNVRSVFIHHFFKDQTDVDDKELFPLVASALDKKNPREWYWALMDYGTHLKAENKNPARRSAHHVKQSKFVGSLRQARGAVLRALAVSPKTVLAIQKESGIEKERILKAVEGLQKEGFIVVRGKQLLLA